MSDFWLEIVTAIIVVCTASYAMITLEMAKNSF